MAGTFAYDQSTAPQATAMALTNQCLGSTAPGGSTMNYPKGVIFTNAPGEDVAWQNFAGTGFVKVKDDGSIVITPASGKTVTISGLDVGANVEVLASDVGNATATFANLTGLTQSGLIASHKYVGRAVLFCNNSQATEGIKFDFNGGSATMTAFKAFSNDIAASAPVIGTPNSTSLAGAINYSTITGENLVTIELSFTVNAAGTLIPRHAENSHIAGTATVEAQSYLQLIDVT